MAFYIACFAIAGLAVFYCIRFIKRVEASQDHKVFNKVLVSHRKKKARASNHRD